MTRVMQSEYIDQNTTQPAEEEREFLSSGITLESLLTELGRSNGDPSLVAPISIERQSYLDDCRRARQLITTIHSRWASPHHWAEFIKQNPDLGYHPSSTEATEGILEVDPIMLNPISTHELPNSALLRAISNKYYLKPPDVKAYICGKNYSISECQEIVREIRILIDSINSRRARSCINSATYESSIPYLETFAIRGITPTYTAYNAGNFKLNNEFNWSDGERARIIELALKSGDRSAMNPGQTRMRLLTGSSGTIGFPSNYPLINALSNAVTATVSESRNISLIRDIRDKYTRLASANGRFNYPVLSAGSRLQITSSNRPIMDYSDSIARKAYVHKGSKTKIRGITLHDQLLAGYNKPFITAVKQFFKTSNWYGYEPVRAHRWNKERIGKPGIKPIYADMSNWDFSIPSAIVSAFFEFTKRLTKDLGLGEPAFDLEYTNYSSLPGIYSDWAGLIKTDANMLQSGTSGTSIIGAFAMFAAVNLAVHRIDPSLKFDSDFYITDFSDDVILYLPERIHERFINEMASLGFRMTLEPGEMYLRRPVTTTHPTSTMMDPLIHGLSPESRPVNRDFAAFGLAAKVNAVTLPSELPFVREALRSKPFNRLAANFNFTSAEDMVKYGGSAACESEVIKTALKSSIAAQQLLEFYTAIHYGDVEEATNSMMILGAEIKDTEYLNRLSTSLNFESSVDFLLAANLSL